jgi:NAD(P) transhydrogenase subunit beta
MLFSALIGSISFSGSLIAFGKLQEVLPGRPITFAGQQLVNALLFAALLAPRRRGRCVGAGDLDVLLLLGALLFGVMLVLPIGGADMPVVISLLNASLGLAAASAGFVLETPRSSSAGRSSAPRGTLLTVLMGRAMNRSIANVLFGRFRGCAGRRAAVCLLDGRQILPRGDCRRRGRDARLRAARRGRFPATGLAVAQAQHA